jgi:hypothetical protein
MQTVTNISGLQIRRLETSDAALYRDIRLEALKQNPEAFGSTFERENAQPLSWFEAAIGRSDIFGAFLNGALAGLGNGLLRLFSTMRVGVWRWSNSLS